MGTFTSRVRAHDPDPPVNFAILREAYEQARSNAVDNGGSVRDWWAVSVRDVVHSVKSAQQKRNNRLRSRS